MATTNNDFDDWVGRRYEHLVLTKLESIAVNEFRQVDHH